MKWLVLIHVLSAIIGIGPTYFGHLLFRNGQTVGGLRQSIASFKLLNFFPKIGGTLAVLTGILLVIVSSWSFSSFWIIGSLVLYVAIQVLVVGILDPVVKNLHLSLQAPDLSQDQNLPETSVRFLSKANRIYYTASILGVLLFTLMIIKP
ncbi:DUF2269 family protein [Paenibacillus periandrae]|uniref:DUF2269 family protein n=1 Tax=Paenibacillus periandrae TaxID=1761741 RepID=UPI001F094B9A|nr:DUF2269 family protein [Paenibacillus periandrae]